MTQAERINAQGYRERFYNPKRKRWEMCMDYLSKHGSISAEEARVAYGEKHLSSTIWYCRKKGYYIKTAKNPDNLRSYAIFVLGDERQKKAEESKPKYTHSTHPRLWKVWASMRYRCNDPKTDSYKNYGGKGIKVCDEWASDFQNFAEWAINNGYDSEAAFGECTIDRIDGNDDYKPSNCRWVTMQQQSNNKCTNVVIAFQGEERTAAEWGQITGIAPDRIRKRLSAGWSVEEALTTRSWGKCLHIAYRGMSKSLSEWSKELHIPADTINRRLKMGWSVEDALTKPVKKQKNNRLLIAE